MSKVKLNKKSVKQQGGAMIPSQPAMSNQQQQVDPMVKQVTELISTSVNQGKEIVDVIIELSQQQVDQQVIAQALMMGGMQQEDVVTLFEQVQVKMQPPGPSSPNEVNNSPELLARNEYLEQQNSNEDGMNPMAKSGIEIKPENKGKFTAWAKARGMSVQEAASKVMANKDNYPPSVVKMANFAKNAAGWKKEDGGDVSNYTEGVRQREGSYNPPDRKYTLDPRFRDYGGEPRSFMEWYGQAEEGDEIENSNAKAFDINDYGGFQNVIMKGAPNPTDNVINDSSREGMLANNNLNNNSFVNQSNQYTGGVNTPGYNQSYNLQDFIGGLNPQGNPILEGLGLLGNIKNELFSKEVGANGLTKGALTGLKDKRKFSKTGKPLYFDTKTTYDTSDENLSMINMYKNTKLAEEAEAQRIVDENYRDRISDASGLDPELLNSEDYFESIGVDINDDLGSEFNAKLYQRYLDAYNDTYPNKRFGGSLPKAQFLGEFPSNDSGYGFDPYNDDLGEFIENAGQTNYVQDTNRIIPKGKREMEVSTDPTSNDYFNQIQGPTTEIENPLSGLLNFVGDTPMARAATSLSKVAVDSAGFANDIFDMKKFENAKEDREEMFMADNFANIKVDGVGNKGFWDVNDGGLMSNKDRVVGIDEATFNMFATPQFSKEGGGVNNPGFKALPPNVQHNILSNMASGGEESYLANRDRVIKNAIASKKQMGGDIMDVDQDLLIQLIAAGADIEIL
jgi:hypothetical protein|tara:strand:- start:1122 stop:3329 length:2208 start_codon:yes stop_codon:yes gene_type:complete